MGVALAGLPLFLDEVGERSFVKREGKYGGNLERSEIKENEPEPSESKEVNSLIVFVRTIFNQKSMKCKNKLLEILMDMVDQGYL